MVIDNEAKEKTAIIRRSRRTRPTPRRMVVEVAKTTGPGPGRITRRPISSRLWRTTRGNMGRIGPDGTGWDPRKTKEPRRIGNPPLSFREYRSQHDGCWVCYGKGNNHAHDHRQCKVYEADKKAYFAAHPEKKPK